MKIKALYHCPANFFPLAKSLGFSHVEVSVGALPGKLELFPEYIQAAHKAGLHCIVEPGFGKNIWAMDYILASGVNLLGISRSDVPCHNCLISLPDEPNMDHVGDTNKMVQVKIDPKLLQHWKSEINKVGYWSIATLGDLGSYRGYEDCADIVAFDLYCKPTDYWRMAKMALQVKLFQLKHHGQLCAVPPIRYGVKAINQWHKFWNWLGIKNRYWYCFSTSEEDWFDKNLDQLPEICDLFKNEINKESL